MNYKHKNLSKANGNLAVSAAICRCRWKECKCSHYHEYYKERICNAPLACTNMCSSDLGYAYKIGHWPRLIISQRIMGMTI